MREIKYRLWNPERNVMTAGNELNTILATTDTEFVKEFDRCKMVWMQYTGLKDKNGKEGYHKDIVSSGEKLYSIEWQNEEARFWLAPYGNNTGTWQFMDMLESFEIIGNIYETPSLIN